MDTWGRERAFFSASVDNADTLNAFRNQIQQILDGKSSAAQAREMMRRHLEESGYKAKPGLEGTIKDLSSPARREIVIKTNVEMAQGWAEKQQFAGDITLPGLRLVRANSPRNPRDWARRCSKFAGRDDVVLTGDPDAPMVALSCSPVWAQLSRFGLPYPPFDYNSGMTTEPVTYDECVQVGLITEENEQEMLDRVEAEYPTSLNESVEVERDYRYKDLVDSLSEQLQGLAQWEGNKLVMTDPNGTKPYDYKAIGKIIAAPLPGGIQNYQKTALQDWVIDSDKFAQKTKDEDTGIGLDEKEDLVRLFERIKPVTDREGKDPVYRGLNFNNKEERDNLVETFKSNGYGARKGFIAESWANNPYAANKYAKENKYGIVLETVSYKSRKRIDSLYRDAIPDYKGPDSTSPINLEGESVFLSGVKFRVTKSTTKGNTVYLNVQEI